MMNGPTDNATRTVVEGESRNLLMRVIAAMVLAPLTIGFAYFGGSLWSILVTLVTVGLFVEWLMIVGATHYYMAIVAGVMTLVISGFCLLIGRFDIAVTVLVMGIVGVAIAGSEHRLWVSGGLLYAGLALVASILVRLDAVAGFLALIFVLLIVWVTDIGGYFVGRGIGGPKLWPRVSPKKTWAGALGGLAGSLVVASVFVAFDLGKMVPLLLLAVSLSVVSQLGDLFESAVKRHFGVKDSSHIIPGHGGLLDRLDGFVAAIVFAALIGFIRGDADGIGRGLMVW